MARFRAAGILHLRSRKVFVVYGDILSGEVRAGMHVALPMNHSFSFTARIAAVEYVDLVSRQRAYVGLVMGYDDPQELGFWEAMNISDEELDIRETETVRSGS